jgi:hypothetical protein
MEIHYLDSKQTCLSWEVLNTNIIVFSFTWQDINPWSSTQGDHTNNYTTKTIVLRAVISCFNVFLKYFCVELNLNLTKTTMYVSWIQKPKDNTSIQLSIQHWQWKIEWPNCYVFMHMFQIWRKLKFWSIGES